MVKFFAQTHNYSEPWQTVTLAFFLRYPNPYASHVLSADVLSRSFTPEGSLVTTRLILKRGSLPAWLPRSVVNRSESWIIEESEVDPLGKVVRCETKNVDHVRILSVRETVELREGVAGSTIQRTEAKLVSKLGWLARRAERYGHEKFQRNLERSRAGIHLIVDLLNQSRLQAMSLKHMHDVGMGYRLPPLTVQGTALDSFRPRFYSIIPPASNSGDAAAIAASSDVGPDSQNMDINEASNSNCPTGPGRRKWRLPRPLSWLWHSSASSSPSSSPPAA